MHRVETLAVGSCYVDIEVGGAPIDEHGIPAGVELVSGGYTTVAGGSAVNFCCLLQQLGTTTSFIGMVGKDDYAPIFERLLSDAGVIPALIRRNDVSTNLGFNLTSKDGKQHNMFAAGTANAALDAHSVLPKLREVAPAAQTLYLGGCFKLKGLLSAYSDIAAIAEAAGTKLVVDHGRIQAETPKETLAVVKELVLKATCYLPSREEFCTLWGVDTIEGGLRRLHEAAPQLIVVVKDSSNGAYYFTDGKAQHVPAVEDTHVISLTGAGDSFNAGFVAAIMRKVPIQRAVEFGCSVAASRISGQEVPSIETI